MRRAALRVYCIDLFEIVVAPTCTAVLLCFKKSLLSAASCVSGALTLLPNLLSASLLSSNTLQGRVATAVA